MGLELGNSEIINSEDRRENSSLDNSQTVQTLNLSGRRLQELPVDLPSFENLLELDLSENYLSECPEKLKQANKLLKLDLSNNQLKTLGDLLENNLKMLRDINLSKNLLRVINKPLCMFQLKSLNLSHNQIHEFPLWLLHESFYIVNLDFSMNPLFQESRVMTEPVNPTTTRTSFIYQLNLSNTSFSEKDLTLLRYFHSSLIKLDLGNIKSRLNMNRISEIPIKYLPPGLIELKMRNVALATLPDVEELRNLKILDVSQNSLCFLPDKLCLSPSLQTLILTKCSLYVLPKEIGSIVTLVHLDVSHNDICSLPTSVNKLENLVHLDVYNNAIQSLPDLDGLKNLREFDICQNEFPLPPSTTFGEYTYDELREALRATVKEDRCNGERDKTDSKSRPECDLYDSRSDEEYSLCSETPKSCNQSSYDESEDWGDGGIYSQDNFDDEYYKTINKSVPTYNEDDKNSVEELLSDCLKHCPESILRSPLFYQPATGRRLTSFFNREPHITHQVYAPHTTVDGQFDDL